MELWTGQMEWHPAAMKAQNGHNLTGFPDGPQLATLAVAQHNDDNVSQGVLN
jgi:hypothetical protein